MTKSEVVDEIVRLLKEAEARVQTPDQALNYLRLADGYLSLIDRDLVK